MTRCSVRVFSEDSYFREYKDSNKVHKICIDRFLVLWFDLQQYSRTEYIVSLIMASLGIL
eukprot:snap_masked-scaffold_39-processed-gene-1.38-mRNA-1 protein AED:1.00 eAED:1.00 QI:0/0/0/0/1/1/2/0/59